MFVEFYNVSRSDSLYLTGTLNGSLTRPRIEASNTLRSNNTHNTIDPEELMYLPDDSSAELRLTLIHDWFVAMADIFPGDTFQIRFFQLRPNDPVMTRRCETIGIYVPVYRGNNRYTFDKIK